MNEKTEAVPVKGLKGAPFGPCSSAPIEGPWCPIGPPEKLHGEDLRGGDLAEIKGLLPEHLAGADLTGAKLPEEVAKFPALGQVAAISSEARKIFISLLAACVYSWLVIGTTTDVALILNTASSPLPIINTPIPIAGFYVVGGAVLAAVYCYLLFYLQRLWRTLAALPARFPDGTAVDDKTDPWPLINLVRVDFVWLRPNAPPLARLENLLAVFLAWWLVPVTLLALWTRYLPAHGWRGTTSLVFLVGATTLFGRHTYRLARAALQGRASSNVADEADESRSVLKRAWHELRQLHPDKVTAGVIGVLIVCSVSAFRDNPRDPYTWVAKSLNALHFVGVRTYADLREVDVAQRPEGWTGNEWDKVKQVDLRDVNLTFADATRAFLAGADLRGANLTGAILERAELRGAVLYDADRDQHAQLQGSNLSWAQLQGANLFEAQLQGANLSWAQLQGANLSEAKLQGANLSWAQLQGANLFEAQLQGAVLGMAQLQGANLTWARLQGAAFRGFQYPSRDRSSADLRKTPLSVIIQVREEGAQLQGAVLWGAELQGTDLGFAQLQGADLRRSNIWRAWAGSDRRWDLADLRGSIVAPMTASQVDSLISEATKSISNEELRKSVAERMGEALRYPGVPARPNFPKTWQSEPNVMFDENDPAPEPFGWGRRQWATEEAYDEQLAKFLGALACDPNAPVALTLGLARRARGDFYLGGEPERLWARPFAARLTGPGCTPASALPEDLRHELEQLAAQDDDTSVVAPETSPP